MQRRRRAILPATACRECGVAVRSWTPGALCRRCLRDGDKGEGMRAQRLALQRKGLAP